MLPGKYDTGIRLYFDLQTCFLMQRGETNAFAAEFKPSRSSLYTPQTDGIIQQNPAPSQPQMETPLDSVLPFLSFVPLSKGRDDLRLILSTAL